MNKKPNINIEKSNMRQKGMSTVETKGVLAVEKILIWLEKAEQSWSDDICEKK